MARSSSWQFGLPTQIRFGRGSVRKLADVAGQFGHSVVLVGYRDQTGLEEIYDQAVRQLKKAEMDIGEFFQVWPDPDAELPLEGARLARLLGADVVIGLGGGSVIDAAKGIAALAKLGGTLWDYTGANKESRPITDALPVVAVPTTAGTGTEATGVAVFSHKGKGIKASVYGPAVAPKVALVDPELTVGSPPSLTAACGFDALGHAIEARISRRANPISSMLAGRAVALIVENLPKAVTDPHDPLPREPLALAATLAGAAFSEAGVVVTHAIAQALGGVLHVPHGLAVALGTPLNLRYNAPTCATEYCELADCCGITADSVERKAELFVETIVDLQRSVGLPDRLDVAPDAPHDLVDTLAQNALESTPVPITLNPRKVDEAALKKMFTELLRY